MVPAPTDDRESSEPLTVCPGQYQRHLVVALHHDHITLRCLDPDGDDALGQDVSAKSNGRCTDHVSTLANL